MQERLDYLYQQLVPQASHPLLQQLLEAFRAIDIEKAIADYTQQMLANYQLWWEKYAYILAQDKPKFSGIFFEHSYIYEYDMYADAYGF
jgi:hypothetical protein